MPNAVCCRQGFDMRGLASSKITLQRQRTRAATFGRCSSNSELTAQLLSVCVLVTQSCLTLCDPMDCSPQLLCPWDFPGKNTRVSCHSLLQGIVPTQGWNLGLLHCRKILHHLSHQQMRSLFFNNFINFWAFQGLYSLFLSVSLIIILSLVHLCHELFYVSRYFWALRNLLSLSTSPHPFPGSSLP